MPFLAKLFQPWSQLFRYHWKHFTFVHSKQKHGRRTVVVKYSKSERAKFCGACGRRCCFCISCKSSDTRAPPSTLLYMYAKVKRRHAESISRIQTLAPLHKWLHEMVPRVLSSDIVWYLRFNCFSNRINCERRATAIYGCRSKIYSTPSIYSYRAARTISYKSTLSQCWFLFCTSRFMIISANRYFRAQVIFATTE
jgi:hypothetical protein